MLTKTAVAGYSLARGLESVAAPSAHAGPIVSADQVRRVQSTRLCRLPDAPPRVVKKTPPVYSAFNSAHRIAAQTGANGGRSP